MGIAAILALINAAIPNIASLWVLIHHADGTVSPLVILNDADAGFSANLTQISNWVAAHPVTTATPKA